MYRILGVLSQYGALHFSELARRAGVSTKTLWRYLPELERRELVKSVYARGYRVVLITEEGEELLKKMEESMAVLA